jgi:hypothetical protein
MPTIEQIQASTSLSGRCTRAHLLATGVNPASEFLDNCVG